MGLYLGLISGTSMDAIDAALVDFDAEPLSLVAASATAFDAELKRRISALIDSRDAVALDEVGQIDVAVAQAFAQCTLKLLKDAGVSASSVQAIGSHGQTLRHRPDLAIPFTWQIGDPNTLAELTGITVVGDFRRRDVAAGGQGAPLLPVFHDQVFRSGGEDRVILNLGGIANITILRQDAGVSGFDTGPANRLLDAWIARHRGAAFDDQGGWAGTGRCDQALLEELLAEPYFALPPPKSTGRELFNMPWLEKRLGSAERRPQDVQATLLAIQRRGHRRRRAAVMRPGRPLYACGGGAHNTALLAAIARRLAPNRVATTAVLGPGSGLCRGDRLCLVRAAHARGLPSSPASVTGAQGARILGGIYRYA